MHELTSSVQKHNDGGDGKAESAGEPEVFECSEVCRGCQRQEEVTVTAKPSPNKFYQEWARTRPQLSRPPSSAYGPGPHHLPLGLTVW